MNEIINKQKAMFMSIIFHLIIYKESLKGKYIRYLFLLFLNDQAFAQTNGFDGWNIVATDTANYNPAFLGNGYIGVRTNAIGLKTNEVFINGLYDAALGEMPRFVSYYKPFDINVIIKGKGELVFGKEVTNWKQTLNLREGILYTAYKYAGIIGLQSKLMALRNNPMCVMNAVEFEALEDVELTIENKVEFPDRTNVKTTYSALSEYKLFQGYVYPVSDNPTRPAQNNPILYTVIPTLSGKDCIAGANTYYFPSNIPDIKYKKLAASHKVSFNLSLKKGQKYSFCLIGSYLHTGLSSDPLNDALRACAREYDKGYETIIDQHKEKWADLWESDIEIDGDTDAQRDVRVALYSLYSSIAAGSGFSIPPCGLSNDGWGSHIFWDAEIWMLPPLLLMQPSFAQSMLDFRINTIPQCKKRAASFGYKGIMFPWESDMTGNECCPVSYKLDMNEHHITADVGIGFWNYYRATQDKKWLSSKGYPMLKDIADFWSSRATVDSLGKYHILNVIGPDEYHENVDDNAFTNGAAKECLHAVTKSARLLNEIPNPEWQKVADGLVILKAPEGHTLQFNGYKGDKIKQADVNLLSYPLDIITDKAQILKDLNYYEPRIDSIWGPAMGRCILATLHARYGNVERAYGLFKKSYQPNLRKPFYFISEMPGNNNNQTFCTGYGGVLQSVIFGFGGFKITDVGIIQESVKLPQKWTRLTIKINGKEYGK